MKKSFKFSIKSYLIIACTLVLLIACPIAVFAVNSVNDTTLVAESDNASASKNDELIADELSETPSAAPGGEVTESEEDKEDSTDAPEIKSEGTPNASIDENTNLCREQNVTATCSNTEGAGHTADKAIDGDTSSNTSRWATDNDSAGTTERTLTIDLGTSREIGSAIIYWEVKNATNYVVETSSDSSNWTAQVTKTQAPSSNKELLSFANKVNARYIRLRITAYGESVANWYNVSVYEFEVYGATNPAPQTAASVLEGFQLEVSGGKVEPVASTLPNGYSATYAANYEQLVGGDDGKTVFTPLVDTPCEFDVTITKDGTDDKATSSAEHPIVLTIPGTHSQNEGNEKPHVIPEIVEWYSASSEQGETFTLNSSAKIVASNSFKSVAEETAADIEDLFGFKPQIVTSGASSGDIVLTEGDGTGDSAGFDYETYKMSVSDKVEILATNKTGALWGTRSLLQALKFSGNKTVPVGAAKDYPEFKLRGFMIDVGRKPMSIEMLKTMAKNMTWYKLNDFHVHVSDNLIFMEDYGVNAQNYNQEGVYEKANNAYSAFRLESSLKSEDGGIQLASKDYHYTKSEWKEFDKYCSDLGVNLVPEIDVPAHAKGLVDAFPSLRLKGFGNGHPWNDHFDLGEQKYAQSLSKIQSVFDDYIDDNTFGSTVHFGADEYYDNHACYRRFFKDMVKYLKDKGKTPRVWGSLSYMSGGTTAGQSFDIDANDTKGVQMNIWNTGWANPQYIYNLGFDIINITDNPAYMVPNGNGGRGVYGDYLNLNNIYSWSPNCVGGTWLPSSSPQMLGASYAIWQDNIDTRAAGIDEEDTFVRFFDTLPVASVRQWGEGASNDRTLAQLLGDVKKISYAPTTNPTNEGKLKEGTTQYFRYDFKSTADKSSNGHDLQNVTNATISNGELTLKGGKSYVELKDMDKLGWGTKLSFEIYKDSKGSGVQTIFESDHAYGDFSIKALPVEGKTNVFKLGFSRELYDFVFDEEIPCDKWVNLTLTNGDGECNLSVDGGSTIAADGKFVSNANSNTAFSGKASGVSHASFTFPLARIGSAGKLSSGEGAAASALIGKIRNVYATQSFNKPIIEDDTYDIKPSENTYSATAGSELVNGASTTGEGGVINAIDGNENSWWHSNWSTATPDNPSDLTNLPEKRFIQIELATPTSIGAFRYKPRPTVANGIVDKYRVEVSENGEDWKVTSYGLWPHNIDWKIAYFDTSVPKAKYIRLYGLTTNGSAGDPTNKFMSAAEIRVTRRIDWQNDGVTSAFLDSSSYKLEGGIAEPKPTVTFSGSELILGRDYYLEYENNTSSGRAKVIIHAKGTFTGTLSCDFDVV